ncbi:MAG: hypothetical protein IJ389_03745 [Clostridia bacterium]|nr:hypothetical protein [Clostridia bacterium]
MKRIIIFALAVMTAVLCCSCSSDSNKAEDTTVPENGVTYEYSEEDPSKKTAAVVYENGVEVSRDNYQYEEDGNIKTVQTVKDGKTVKTTTYEYEGGVNTKVITEFTDDGVACKEVAEMDNGRIASITYFEDGEKTGKVLYSYDDDGNMIREETVDDDGNVISHKENTYDNFGKLVRVDCYEFGSLSLSYEYAYKDGVISATKCYDSKGNLLWEK